MDLARRARLLTRVDRARTTVAWAVARRVLGDRLDTPPEVLRVERTCPRCGAQHGRPRLPDHPDTHVSVAHGGQLVAVVVGTGHPVGVDVEPVVLAHPVELPGVAAEVLSARELSAWSRRPGADLPRALTAAWVAKEAALKAAGVGLLVPLPEVDVALDATGRVAGLVEWPLAGRRPWLREVPAPDPRHLAAVARLGPAPTAVTHHDAGPLLEG